MNAYLLDLIDREVSRPTVAEVLERAARRSERASTSAAEAVADARAESSIWLMPISAPVLDMDTHVSGFH